jgi:hypothetical protein
LAHAAEKRERTAKHRGGIGQLAGGNGGPNPAAADSFVAEKHWVRIIEKNFSFRTPLPEKLHISRAVFAESPVRSDRDGLQGGKGPRQFGKKIGWLLAGAGSIKRQSDNHPDLPSSKNTKLMGQAGDEGWMFFRVQNGEGMVAEGKDGGLGGGVGLFAAENDATVAQMETVEKSQGKMADGGAGGGGVKGVDDGHVRRMREISGREIRWRAR